MRARSSGFTLLEVMIGLALLGFGLVVLIKSTAGNIMAAEQAHMMGVATDLARGKMYDIEEKLLKDGFTDTDQSQTDLKPFDEEGWPNVFYSYKVEQVEMPSWDDLQALAKGHATKFGTGSGSGGGSGTSSSTGSGSGSGYAFGSGSSDMLNNFQNSALGGMLGMMGSFGGKGGMDIQSAQGGALIQMQYQLFQQILKVSIRKVTLTVAWKALGSDRDMKVVAFFTDAVAMDKVLNGMGSQPVAATGSATGSGSGSGSGSAVSGPNSGSGKKGP